MIQMVAASSLSRLIQNMKCYQDKKRFSRLATAIPGLSVNPNTKETVQNLLKNKLARRY